MSQSSKLCIREDKFRVYNTLVDIQTEINNGIYVNVDGALFYASDTDTLYTLNNNIIRPLIDQSVSANRAFVNIELDGLTRNVPTGLPALPMQLLGTANGLVQCNYPDAISAMKVYHAALFNNVTYYVKSTGSDSNSGLTTALPFLTLAKALQTATGAVSIIKFLDDMVVPGIDFRNTSASEAQSFGEQIKIVDANGFNVIIRETGPDITTATWAVDGTYANCWTTTLTMSGTSSVITVVDNTTLDIYGYPKQLKSYASAILLDAATQPGFFWDSTGKVLWINNDGKNIQQTRRQYRALYSNASNLSRLHIQGAKLGLKGIRIEGLNIVFGDGGSRRPEVWLHDCLQLWALDKGVNMSYAGWFISTDSHIHSSLADGVNAFTPSATGKGLIMTIRSQFTSAGNRDIYAADGTKQGISAHGGSNHVSFGSYFALNNAPGVGDTCVANQTDYTWLVACKFDKQADANSSMRFGGTAVNSSRTIYIDSCVSNGPAGADIIFDANAVVYSYNTDLPVQTGGTVGSYLPNAI